MKKILIVLFIIGVLIIGCDRYKHNFTTEPNNQTTPQQFFDRFKDILTKLDTTNIDTIMNYYDENYLNNGETKDDMRAFYQSLLNYNFTEIRIENEQIAELTINYNLLLMNQADTLFTKDISDVLKKSGESYLFYGNQQSDNQEDINRFFDRFKDVLTRIDTTNIDTIMNFYDENYLNNGETKDDMRAFYQSLLNYNFTEIRIENEQITDLTINYNLLLMNQADTLFTKDISDVLVKSGESYLFYGNQESGTQVSKQRVMVELFTGTLCQNCPYAEEALEELKTELGDKFSYVEFHKYIADPLEIPINATLYYYYGLSSVPKAIFQGQTIMDNYHDQTTDYYRESINHYADMDAVATLDSLSYTLNGTEFNGRIKITFIDNNLLNLKLKAVLVEKVTDVTNFNGDLCKQAVFAYSDTDITPDTGFYDFTIADLPDTIPDDTQAVIWIQTIDETYNPDTCKVYNVYEEDIH